MYSEKLISKVKKNIDEKNMLAPDMKVVVGVSGGADSMALADILVRLFPGHIICAHMEHGIRGGESVADSELVQRYCEKRNIPFFIRHINAVEVASERRMSVEQAARAERYLFFDEVRMQTGADRIAVAHHLDDVAETVIFNLIRGTGAKGLAAMEWVRDDGVIRPFLNITKEEITYYCVENNIEYCIDSTNSDTDYSRNLIRAQVLPALKKINPSAARAISRTAELLRADDEWLEAQAREQADGKIQVTKHELRVARDVIAANPRPLSARIIRQALSQWGIDRDIEAVHIAAVINMVKNSHTGSGIDLSHHLTAVLSYDDVVFCYPRKADFTPQAFAEGAVSGPVGDIEVSRETRMGDYLRTERLDRAKIPAGAVFRLPQEGDTIVPLGMTGRKKLTDYMCDKKIEAADRQKRLVLAEGNRVYWVQGAGISQLVRMDENTKEIIEIREV